MSSSECCEIFKNTCLKEHLTAASDFFKAVKEKRWAAASKLTVDLDNLLIGYEKLSY